MPLQHLHLAATFATVSLLNDNYIGSGRVAHCRVRGDAELARLAAKLSELPRAAFVHPGTRPPEGRRTGAAETFGRATAKGLDFSVVAVIGAGRHISDAQAHAAQGATEPFYTALAAR